jgi:SET domain-containing protein
MEPTPNIPSDCWLHASAEPRPSPIQGLGLFATQPIAAGEVVMRLGGAVIDGAALKALEPPYDSVTLDEDLHLLIDPAHPVRFGNHGCDPNLWHRDAVTIVARYDIEAGAELTIDYATHTIVEWWSMACACRSPLCRGRVTGADWKLESLQRAYDRHWTPALLQRIDSAVG